MSNQPSNPDGNNSQQQSIPNHQQVIQFTYEDISNFNTFMDSLVNLLNEGAQAVSQIKDKLGYTPECKAPVKMSEQDQKRKMNDIIKSLLLKYSAEYATENGRPLPSADSAYESSLGVSPLSAYSSSAATASGLGPSDSAGAASMTSAASGGKSHRTASRMGGKTVRNVTAADQYCIPLAESTGRQYDEMGYPIAQSTPKTSGPLSAIFTYERQLMPAPWKAGEPEAGFSDLSAFGTNLNRYGFDNILESTIGSNFPDCFCGSVQTTGRRGRKGHNNTWSSKPARRTY